MSNDISRPLQRAQLAFPYYYTCACCERTIAPGPLSIPASPAASTATVPSSPPSSASPRRATQPAPSPDLQPPRPCTAARGRRLRGDRLVRLPATRLVCGDCRDHCPEFRRFGSNVPLSPPGGGDGAEERFPGVVDCPRFRAAPSVAAPGTLAEFVANPPGPPPPPAGREREHGHAEGRGGDRRRWETSSQHSATAERRLHVWGVIGAALSVAAAWEAEEEQEEGREEEEEEAAARGAALDLQRALLNRSPTLSDDGNREGVTVSVEVVLSAEARVDGNISIHVDAVQHDNCGGPGVVREVGRNVEFSRVQLADLDDSEDYSSSVTAMSSSASTMATASSPSAPAAAAHHPTVDPSLTAQLPHPTAVLARLYAASWTAALGLTCACVAGQRPSVSAGGAARKEHEHDAWALREAQGGVAADGGNDGDDAQDDDEGDDGGGVVSRQYRRLIKRLVAADARARLVSEVGATPRGCEASPSKPERRPERRTTRRMRKRWQWWRRKMMMMRRRSGRMKAGERGSVRRRRRGTGGEHRSR